MIGLVKIVMQKLAKNYQRKENYVFSELSRPHSSRVARVLGRLIHVPRARSPHYERDDGRPHSWTFPLVVLRMKRIHRGKGFKIAACMKSALCYHSQNNCLLLNINILRGGI